MKDTQNDPWMRQDWRRRRRRFRFGKQELYKCERYLMLLFCLHDSGLQQTKDCFFALLALQWLSTTATSNAPRVFAMVQSFESLHPRMISGWHLWIVFFLRRSTKRRFICSIYENRFVPREESKPIDSRRQLMRRRVGKGSFVQHVIPKLFVWLNALIKDPAKRTPHHTQCPLYSSSRRPCSSLLYYLSSGTRETTSFPTSPVPFVVVIVLPLLQPFQACCIYVCCVSDTFRCFTERVLHVVVVLCVVHVVVRALSPGGVEGADGTHFNEQS